MRTDNPGAHFTDAVLTLTLPKAVEVKTKTIKVRTTSK